MGWIATGADVPVDMILFLVCSLLMTRIVNVTKNEFKAHSFML